MTKKTLVEKNAETNAAQLATRPGRRLVLHRETLRALNESELAVVAGGKEGEPIIAASQWFTHCCGPRP